MSSYSNDQKLQLIMDSIPDLLMQHDSISIPGFGCFAKKYKPAMVDYHEGKIFPPGANITFNDSIQNSDGTIEALVSQQLGLSKTESQKLAKDFGNDLNEIYLSGKEINFPNLGTLQKFPGGQTYFTQTNFVLNQNTVSLPDLDFRPLSRTSEVQELIAESSNEPEFQSYPTPLIQKFQEKAVHTENIVKPNEPSLKEEFPAPGSIEDEKQKVGYKWLPLALGLSFLAIASSLAYIFMIEGKKTSPKSEIAAENYPDQVIHPEESHESKVVPDPNPVVETPKTVKPEPESPIVEADSKAKEPNQPTKIQSEKKVAEAYLDKNKKKPTKINTGSNEAIIVIGSFADQNNASKLSEKIKKAGFGVYTKDKGNLTVVGAKVKYDEVDDLNKALDRIQAKFNDQAFIMK
jgi:nucleoid DNA-binding protein